MLYTSVELISALVGGPKNAELSTTHLKYLCPMLIATACYLSSGADYKSIYSMFQLFTWGHSLLLLTLLVVVPDMVIGRSTDTEALKFIPFRMTGVCDANGLAFMAAMYLLLSPGDDRSSKRKIVPVLLDMATLLVLILAQSKTIYILLPVALCIKYAMPRFMALGSLEKCCVSFGGISLIVLVGILISSSNVVDAVSDATAISSESLMTMTGRVVMWDAALEDWKQHPLLGCGAIYWDEGTGSVRKGHFVFAHAHNQVVQTLWESGIVGLAALALLVGQMIHCALRSHPAERAGLVAAVFAFVTRGYAEVPVQALGTSAVPFMIHMTLMSLLYASTRRAAWQQRTIQLNHAAVERHANALKLITT